MKILKSLISIPLITKTTKYWQGLSPFRKNITFGILITLILLTFRNGQFIAEIEDSSADSIMTLYRGNLVKKNTPPFVILDIDEDTYQDWGEPFITPRDKLLKLLQFAIKGKPKLIIVDIAINKQPHQASGLHPDDLALQQYLAQYEKTHCSQSDCPKILLTRTFNIPKGIRPFDPNTDPYYLAQRSTFLDEIVMRSPNIYWAATRFEREHDILLRRWELSTPTCTNNVPDIIPSMPLLATTLLHQKYSSNLRDHLNHFKPNCNGDSKKLQDKPKQFVVSKDLKFDIQTTRLSRRILYTIPWYLKGEKLPTISDRRELLTIMSANKILNKKASHKPLHNSVTIIGGSYIKGRDWHATPLDWMPGTLVLVNSIQSLLQYGVLKPPSNIWILIFSTILIVLTSWLLVKYGKLKGAIYSFIIIIGFIIFSFAVFQYSIWFSFAIPWTAVQIRQGFDF